MPYLVSSLEGKVAWLLGVVATAASMLGLGAALRLGEAGMQASVAAKCVFPFAFLSAGWATSFWDAPILILFLQFPIYALAVVTSNLFGRGRQMVVVIALAHTAAVVLVAA